MRGAPSARAVAALASVALAASACGGSRSSSDDGADAGGAIDRNGAYCTLVKQSLQATQPSPPASLAKGDPAAIRAWVDKVLTPQIAKVDAIIAVAPSGTLEDWRALRDIEQGLAEGLNDFLEPTSLAEWRKLPEAQRSARFLSIALAPLKGVDQQAPNRISAEVAKDCKVTAGS